jgi:hypothetical protein
MKMMVLGCCQGNSANAGNQGLRSGPLCEPATCHGWDPWSHLEIVPNQSLNRFYDQVWWIFVARWLPHLRLLSPSCLMRIWLGPVGCFSAWQPQPSCNLNVKLEQSKKTINNTNVLPRLKYPWNLGKLMFLWVMIHSTYHGFLFMLLVLV